MPEKSAAATQAATSRPLVTSSKNESISQRIEDVYSKIARRAYELFESKGRAHGHDVEHWLEAENQILPPVTIPWEANAHEYVGQAEVPGYTADDLEVQVEGQQLILTGSCQSKKETK